MYKWQDIMHLVATIYGEARGESHAGKIAVAHVIMNRHKSSLWFSGDTIREVVTRPYQFSCWNHNDPNHYHCHRIAYEWMQLGVMDDPVVQECIRAALDVLLGKVPDDTEGSHHYVVNGLEPSWHDASKIIGRIGNHTFYKGIV